MGTCKKNRSVTAARAERKSSRPAESSSVATQHRPKHRADACVCWMNAPSAVAVCSPKRRRESATHSAICGGIGNQIARNNGFRQFRTASWANTHTTRRPVAQCPVLCRRGASDARHADSQRLPAAARQVARQAHQRRWTGSWSTPRSMHPGSTRPRSASQSSSARRCNPTTSTTATRSSAACWPSDAASSRSPKRSSGSSPPRPRAPTPAPRLRRRRAGRRQGRMTAGYVKHRGHARDSRSERPAPVFVDFVLPEQAWEPCACDCPTNQGRREHRSRVGLPRRSAPGAPS